MPRLTTAHSLLGFSFAEVRSAAISLLRAHLDIAGASLEKKDLQAQTPLDLAVQQRRVDCVTLLRLCKLSMEEEGNKGRDEASLTAAIRDFLSSISQAS